MEYIFTPWKNRLIEDIQSAESEVILVSPFIKSSIARDIYAVLGHKGVSVRTISRFAKAEFISGASDIDAHFMLSGNETTSGNTYELRMLSSVHAKIFIIDDKIAYLGSSNLTFSGLLRNFEGAVRLSDVKAIAPLKQRMLSLWNTLRPITKADFVTMLPMIASAKLSRRGEEADHFYDTRTAIDNESATSNDTVLHEVAQTRFWTPITHEAPPSIGELMTDNGTEQEMTAAEATPSPIEPAETESAEIQMLMLTRQRIELHVKIAERFLTLLSNRFDIDVKRNASRYASALRTHSIRKFWNEEILPRERFGAINPDFLYGDFDSGLETLGFGVFQLCSAHIAVKMGIVRQFGFAIASLFVSKAGQVETLAALWDGNLLGHTLASLSFDIEDNKKVRQRIIATALRRLIAAIYLEEGLPRTVGLVEEFMNPADFLGTDIVTLIDLEDPKSILQNVSKMALHVNPTYDEGMMRGPAHHSTWETTVTVGNVIRATGTGTSLREAQMAAARIALDSMAKHKKWAPALLDYRNKSYSKAYKPSHPLFPQANLDGEMADHVSSVYEKRYGFKIKSSLGYAACIDQETRSLLKLPYSNATMAWFGSYLYQIFRHEIEDLRNTPVAAGFWDGLSNFLDIRGLRKDLGIKVDADQNQQISQAFVTALYFSNPYDKVRSFFISAFQKLAEDQRRKAPKNLMTRDELGSLVEHYDATVVYPSVLQELIQVRTTVLPAYTTAVLHTSPGSLDAIEVTARWQDILVRARGPNKAAGRSKCAFQLLQKLLQRDEFWVKNENGALLL